MHEEYVKLRKAPVLALGDLVAFKQGKKDGWDFGWVYFNNAKTWKPGDPLGDMINIRRCPRNFGEPMLIENCIHVGDPLYEFDTSGTRSCWEKVCVDAMTVSNMGSMYNELLEELKKAKIAEAEVVKLKAELEQLKIMANNAVSDVAKFSSLLSQIQVPKKAKEAA
jgi:hypothetical protein